MRKCNTYLFPDKKEDLKNKQYSQLEISVVECNTIDIIRTSQSWDSDAKEWYGNDEHWGVNA